MEELFNGQLSFADIDAEKFLHVRRAHADRRVNAMDRLTDDPEFPSRFRFYTESEPLPTSLISVSCS